MLYGGLRKCRNSAHQERKNVETQAGPSCASIDIQKIVVLHFSRRSGADKTVVSPLVNVWSDGISVCSSDTLPIVGQEQMRSRPTSGTNKVEFFFARPTYKYRCSGVVTERPFHTEKQHAEYMEEQQHSIAQEQNVRQDASDIGSAFSASAEFISETGLTSQDEQRQMEEQELQWKRAGMSRTTRATVETSTVCLTTTASPVCRAATSVSAGSAGMDKMQRTSTTGMAQRLIQHAREQQEQTASLDFVRGD